MNTRRRISMAALLVISVAVFSVASAAQVRDLGINAFLDQHGPNDSQTWIDPSNNNIMRIDAYGRLNTLFALGRRITCRSRRMPTESPGR